MDMRFLSTNTLVCGTSGYMALGKPFFCWTFLHEYEFYYVLHIVCDYEFIVYFIECGLTRMASKKMDIYNCNMVVL